MASKPTAVKDDDTTATAEGGGRKKKLIVVGAVVGVVLAAAAYFFLLAPGAAEAEEVPEPEKGEVLRLDPISLNLANGSYLKLGLALQVTADAAHKPDGSQAQDFAITLFTGRTKEELSDPVVREALKAELVAKVGKETHDEVFDIYFTEFVTQ